MGPKKSGKKGAGLVKRVPVYQASMDSNPMHGNIRRSGKGRLVKQVPSFQANSGKDMIGTVKVGPRSTKARMGSMKDVQRITQKAGLTNQGYGI